MSKDELKPCPFCGSEVKFNYGNGTYGLYCTNESCILDRVIAYANTEKERKELIKRWNKRVKQ